MKYDGDGRETARFFSDKGCRRAPLFTAPADAARHKRCLWSVSRARRARDGRFYRSRLAGLVMTVLTVGLVSCAGKSLPRFWPGDFFPTFYACHLAVLGVLAL